MPKHINTFIKGLDMDTNVNSYSNQSYPYALNMRILSDGTFESGTLTNMEDKKLMLQIPTGETVVGVSNLRDNIIIFTKTSSTVGKIYKVTSTDLLAANTVTLGASHLLASKSFNFGDNVQIVARYETPSIQKIYWVDGVNPLRFANIANDISGEDVSKFNIVQNVTLSTPTLNSIVSGNLTSGVYQYAYCLYDNNGAETSYSPATQIIPLSGASLSEGTSMNFKGSDIGVNSSKGVKIDISNIDTDFTGIRIIRLFYSTQTGTPEINIVYEGTVSSSISFTDSGSTTLGTLILEDFRYIPNIFSATTLEVKNDFLFAGNTVETSFDIDFDARAYRFSSVRDGYLYDDVTYEGNDPNGIFIRYDTYKALDIPETHNCAQHVNIISRSSGLDKFQSDGRILGGEGKYVKYTFVVKTRKTDNAVGSGTPFKTFTTSYNDLSNPLVIHEQLGYQRGEIYRFGLVLYDSYGRQSFVKRIADIRIPDEDDDAAWSVLNSAGEIQDIGIEFTLKNEALSLLDNATSWQIVRAERTYADATVKDCGYVGNLNTNTTNSVKFRPSLSVSSSSASKALEYLSPETVYNKNNNVNYNRIDSFAASTYSTTRKDTGSGDRANSFVLRRNPAIVSSVTKTYTTGTVLYSPTKTQSNTSIVPLYSTQLTNVFEPAAVSNRCVHGTCLILKVDSALTNNSSGYYVRRRSFNYPYGGYDYNAIRSTIYYPCSPLYDINTTPVEVFGGDCYIGIFEYMRGLMSKSSTVVGDASSPTTRMGNQIAYLLVETKLNLMYTVNPRWSRLDSGTTVALADTRALATGAYVYNAMWETSGVHEAGVPAGGTQEYYEQNYNLYTYNSVYSVMDKSKIFFIRPDNLEDSNSIDTRIYRTSRKINGELADSWTKFPVNNFIDVDTKYGALTKLLTFKDKLFYFQEKGVGIIPIQEREVVTSQSGSATTLGVGGVMERYDYISTSSGTNNLYAICTSNNGIYYIDTYNKKIARLSENIEFLSDMKGIRSDLPSKAFTNLSTIYNSNYNELWFYIDDITYILNEYTGAFISQVNDVFKFSFTTENKNFIVNGLTGYRLDEPNTYRSWKLSLICNPNNVITNRYDSISLSSHLNNLNGIPLTHITASTRVDTTGKISLTSSNLRNRFKTWIFNSLRDSTSGERLYDSYLKIELEGDDSDRVKLYDVLTNYSPINNR